MAHNLIHAHRQHRRRTAAMWQAQQHAAHCALAGAIWVLGTLLLGAAVIAAMGGGAYLVTLLY